MTKTKTAWLALSLLASVSVVAAMTVGVWRVPAGAGASPDQNIAQIEPVAVTTPQPADSAPPQPVDNTPPQPITWPQQQQAAASSEETSPDPSPVLRGAQLPPDPAPPPAAAPDPAPGITGRHWHDTNGGPRLTPAIAQQIKNARDSKAEMRVKRSKAAANTKSCTPSPPNSFTGLLRKLNLAPRCAT
jgi:hypothetical protein